jgi:hypothetical protein
MPQDSETGEDFGFNQAELDDESSILSLADLDAQEKKLVPVEPEEEEEEAKPEPKMTDPEWSDFVMSQFADNETSLDGNPFVAGLRRVARKVLGPVITSRSRIVQAPSLLPGGDTRLQPAVVEHTLIFLCTRVESGMAAYEMEVTDVADVYFGNCEGEYARFASSTAATRAEARAYRKALLLNRVAEEEKTLVPLEDAGVDGCITKTQINFIDILCKRNNVNVMKLVNSGKKKYDDIKEVPSTTGAKIVEYLSGLQNDQTKVTEAMKGYDGTWRQ